MRHYLRHIWHEQDGALSFEWTLISVLLVFGIVAGLGAARDVIIDELGDTAQAVLRFDQTYSFAGLPLLGIPASQYTDRLGTLSDGPRSEAFPLATSDDGADDGADGG